MNITEKQFKIGTITILILFMLMFVAIAVVGYI
jgi:hypothetical protein